ncbi:MAG: hypothetical protein MUD14_08765 [Hydrococcus sp. Prado102]|jgi:hypothetical protein|nr:hypothetical protein [Hydrococcus sp. Prado102]
MTAKFPSQTPNGDRLESAPISKEEETEFAGLDREQPLQLEEQYRLALDSEEPPPKPVEERGLPRATLVALSVGSLLLTGLGLWLIIKPKPPKVAMQPNPTETPTEAVEAEPDYRAKLALQNQKYDLNQSEEPVAPPSKPEPVVVKQQPIPPSPRRPAQVRRLPTPSPPTLRSVPSPIPKPNPIAPSEPIDPLERWNALAMLGQMQGQLPDSLKTSNKDASIPPSTGNTAQTPSQTIPTINPATDGARIKQIPSVPTATNATFTSTVPVTNLSSSASANPELSPGTQGILNRRSLETDSNWERTSTKTIAIGTTAKGTVSVPLIWDTNTKNQQGYHRFAITLTENLLASDGSVALPANTVLVAEVANVTQDSYLVQASIIAIVATDRQGNVQQQNLAPGTILVQGEEGEPLLAENYADPSADIVRQDLLISLFSGLAKVGEVFTEPEQTATFSNNGFGGLSTSTITQNRSPKIWSAVLDGFFNPLADRLSERSQQQIEELLSRPTVAVVPTKTPISIVVNGIVQIQR